VLRPLDSPVLQRGDGGRGRADQSIPRLTRVSFGRFQSVGVAPDNLWRVPLVREYPKLNGAASPSAISHTLTHIGPP
jgi:hypothetical protein